MSGAETRFNNDLKQGARLSLASNPAASNAIRPSHAGRGNVPTGAAVGTNTPPRHPLPGRNFTPMGGQTQPVSGPQGPPGNSSGILGRLIQEIHLEKLIASPEMQDAHELVNFRDHFRGRDSGPDKGRQVLEILGANYG